MTRQKKRRPLNETSLYVAGWAALTLLGVGAAAIYFWGDGWLLGRTCPFYALTGFSCPGCGGTRALAALLRGQLIASFLLHPAVPYLALGLGWFVISETVDRLVKRLVIPPLRIGWWLWGAVGVALVQFLVKTAMQLAALWG